MTDFLPDSIHSPLQAMAALFTQRGLTLGTAESCTGGLMAGYCTALPGSSGWFKGGVVAYANEVKTALLGVAPSLLAAQGAVSRQVALAMATGALPALGADCSVAFTGIAGPGGGSPEKPVGTVWIATCLQGQKPVAQCFHFSGNRGQIRLLAIRQGIFLLADGLQMK